MAAPHIHHDHDAIAAKARLRADARAASVAPPEPDPTDGAIASQIASIASRMGLGRIAAFWPMRGEPDLRPFMTEHAREGTLLLPRIAGDDHPLAFDRWRPGRGVRPGARGTQVADSLPGECGLLPELILVPLLAFDRSCRRLGRGGGFYDRTLARHHGVPAVGVAFHARLRPDIPTEPHDRPLDAVVTERGTLHALHGRIPPG